VVNNAGQGDRVSLEDAVDRIGAELATWRIVSESDRVEGAALRYADADLQRLADAVDLALVDWRDLLVSVDDA
jgi:hypothetical protein